MYKQISKSSVKRHNAYHPTHSKQAILTFSLHIRDFFFLFFFLLQTNIDIFKQGKIKIFTTEFDCQQTQYIYCISICSQCKWYNNTSVQYF